jgi:hypothetical protein
MGVMKYPVVSGDFNSNRKAELAFPFEDWRYNYTYKNCSSSESLTLESTAHLAKEKAAASATQLDSNPTGDSLYTTWFGQYTEGRHAAVQSNYSKIDDALYQKPINFVCGSSECKSNYYAFVNAGGDIEVFLCPLFWTSPTAGTDTQFGTLVHEVSHEVAETEDHEYGTRAAQDLASTDPKRAIENADNYEYFSENLPSPTPISSLSLSTHTSQLTSGHVAQLIPDEPSAPAHEKTPQIECKLGSKSVLDPGEPGLITLTLVNRFRPLHFLAWNTPFEGGLYGKVFDVFRNEQKLDYQGIMVKRGEPSKGDYLQLLPNHPLRVEFDLGKYYEVGAPGEYRVEPVLHLHDVVVDDSGFPRRMEAFEPLQLNCNSLTFRRAAGATK